MRRSTCGYRAEASSRTALKGFLAQKSGKNTRSSPRSRSEFSSAAPLAVRASDRTHRGRTRTYRSLSCRTRLANWKGPDCDMGHRGAGTSTATDLREILPDTARGLRPSEIRVPERGHGGTSGAEHLRHSADPFARLVLVGMARTFVRRRRRRLRNPVQPCSTPRASCRVATPFRAPTDQTLTQDTPRQIAEGRRGLPNPLQPLRHRRQNAGLPLRSRIRAQKGLAKNEPGWMRSLLHRIPGPGIQRRTALGRAADPTS